MGDRVNKVDYYNHLPNGIECIDVIQYFDLPTGNAMKYLWRNGRKHEDGIDDTDKQIEDLEKAIYYINREIMIIKERKNK